MITHLGISSTLAAQDINFDDIKKCRMLYVEGYMWDGEAQKDACLEAMKYAAKNDVLVSFTFSDPFCVERSRDDFHKLCEDHLDFVFCNADEIAHFSQKENFESSLEYIKSRCKNAFVTNSAAGAAVVEGGTINMVDGFAVKPIDSTGAGDAFAAGALYGVCRGLGLKKAARLGNQMGSRIVQKTGARLDAKDLEEFKQLEQSNT